MLHSGTSLGLRLRAIFISFHNLIGFGRELTFSTLTEQRVDWSVSRDEVKVAAAGVWTHDPFLLENAWARGQAGGLADHLDGLRPRGGEHRLRNHRRLSGGQAQHQGLQGQILGDHPGLHRQGPPELGAAPPQDEPGRGRPAGEKSTANGHL